MDEGRRRCKSGIGLGTISKTALGIVAIAGLLPVARPVWALATSVAAEGIDALRLHEDPYYLTGAKIAIGQVEIGRPGQFGLDKLAYERMPVAVGRVLWLNQWANPDDYVDGHAANVASVMISQDKRYPGVAPDALLYSAAIGELGEVSSQPQECLAAQAVATQNGGMYGPLILALGSPSAVIPGTNPGWMAMPCSPNVLIGHPGSTKPST